MRVSILTDYFPQSSKGEFTGGVEARCFYIAKYLRKKGHTITILARNTTGETWGYSSFSSIPERGLFLLRMFGQAIKLDFDVIEGTNFINNFLAGVIGFLKRKPVVYWYPDVWLGQWQENTGLFAVIGETIERGALLMPANCYIAISDVVKNKLIKAGISRGKIRRVYCGVDFTEIEEVQRNKSIKRYDLCVVGRMLSYKHVEIIVEAMNLVKKKYPEISLAVVGQGPRKKRLVDLVSQLSLQKNVTFLGHIPEHLQVLKTIYSSRIYCSASIVEGFGISIIEAAALGIPYVASKIPVVQEVTKEGRGGKLFQPLNKNDLASKLYQLLTDKNLYIKCFQEGKILAKNYDWEKIAQETEKVYKEVFDG